MVLFLYFLPGVLFHLSLFLFTKPISMILKVSSWTAQMIQAQLILFGSQIVILLLFTSNFGALTLVDVAQRLGMFRFSFSNIVFAVAWGYFSVLLLRWYLRKFGRRLMSFLDKFLIFKIPEWHYQKIKAPDFTPRFASIVWVVLLLTNVVVEKFYFRAFLFDLTNFSLIPTWILNGFLFILYHTFQASKTYALFPLGLLIAGYYALTKDLYGAMVIHFMINKML